MAAPPEGDWNEGVHVTNGDGEEIRRYRAIEFAAYDGSCVL
jgi:hypothetical protein